MLTAIIPARGGSKGVKGKNLREIGGKSLVRIAVEKCLQVADAVVVSSDSTDIARAAVNAGAWTISRRGLLSSDEAATWDVIKNVHDRAPRGWFPGDILLVQCTAPLVTVDDLSRVNDERGDTDVSALCHEFHGFVVDEDGDLKNYTSYRRRQDNPKQYVIAGSAWAFNSSYLREPHMYAGTVRPVLCDGPHCDIDTEEDLETAKALHHWRTPIDWKMS